MTLKFCANISWMFREAGAVPLRYGAAARAGFRGVEAAFLYDIPVEEVVKAKEEAGVEQVLINMFPGNLAEGELGLAALPGRQQAFKDGLELSIKYANALKCKRMHLMAGRVPVDWSREAALPSMEETFVENLKFAADRLEKEGILALIEPINSKMTDPKYFLNTPRQALGILQKVGHKNVKLQMDFFHQQIMDGNLTNSIKEYLPHIGHMQVSQVPGRAEPDSEGEVNYCYVFSVLESVGYDGWIGLEYNPAGDTLTGLEWWRKYMSKAK
ncbi:putative hydroxypyruvate isomerase [Branchiostoma floridae x Branchiostoma belcheri]